MSVRSLRPIALALGILLAAGACGFKTDLITYEQWDAQQVREEKEREKKEKSERTVPDGQNAPERKAPR